MGCISESDTLIGSRFGNLEYARLGAVQRVVLIDDQYSVKVMDQQ